MKKYILVPICFIFCIAILLTGCKNKTHKIEFVVDNEIVETINTKGNEEIKIPIPSKDDYDFGGWFLDKDIWEEEITSTSFSNKRLKKDIKVYAKWDLKTDDTNAEFIGFEEINNNEYSISLPNSACAYDMNDVVEVYETSTWKLCTDISANNSITSKTATLEVGNNTFYVLVTAQNGDIELYTLIIRRRPIYQVNFETFGGTTVQGQNVEENDLLEEPATPFKTGYTFSNWDYDLNEPITSNITISANYTPNTYKIKYHYEDSIVEQSIVYGSNATLKSNTTFNKTAYDLSSWNTLQDGTGDKYNCSQQYSEYSVAHDMDLYAMWTPSTYKITYHYNGGTSVDNINEYNIETDYLLLQSSRDGYDFDSWCTDVELNNKIDNVLGYYGDLDLYAKWSIVSYKITYHLFDGTNGDNISSYTVETNDFELISATKKGYRFEGWYTDDKFENKITHIEKGSYGDLNLYARFTKESYSIIYHLEDGTTTNPVSYTIDDSLIVLSDAVKPGFTFGGWYSEADYKNKISTINPQICEDVELWAKWIMHAGGDGTEISPYLLSKTEHLDLLAELCKNEENYSLNKHFKLANDIDYLGNQLEIIGRNSGNYAFKGCFNGDNYEIKDAVLSSSNDGYSAMFGRVEGAKIYNLSLVNCAPSYGVSGWGEDVYYEGSLIGYAKQSEITNCHVDIKLQTYFYLREYGCNGKYVGGLIGYSNTNIISKCSVNGEINIKDYYDGSSKLNCGGFTGYDIGSTISQSYSKVVISNPSGLSRPSGANRNIGGFIGESSETSITSCYSDGDIDWINEPVNTYSPYNALTINYCIGGFIGTCNFSNIENSFTNVDILVDGYINLYSCAYTIYAKITAFTYSTNSTVVNCISYSDSLDYSLSVNSTANSDSRIAEIYEGLGKCNYYCENTTINIEDDSVAIAKSIEELNDLLFYVETLQWEESVWDFSDLDCESDKLPVLKAN